MAFKSIWKYPLKVTEWQTISVPSGSRILSVQLQYEQLTAWAMVTDSPTNESLSVWAFGTGRPLPAIVQAARFLGTILTAGGSLVFHVFCVDSADGR